QAYGEEAQRPVGVCGEAAGDPGLAVVLVGLGVSSLSMTPRSLPAVARVLSTVSLEQAKDLAAQALAARSAEDARDAVRAGLPILGELGVWAGRLGPWLVWAAALACQGWDSGSSGTEFGLAGD